MRFILRFNIPVATGNTILADPAFADKMYALLHDIKAQASYFTSRNGQRGGYIVLDMDDASHIPAIAEPFFLWLKADLELIPVMTPEDLVKAGPSIEAAIKKWG